MRAVFMGTPSFAIPVVTALLKGGIEVVAVYTQPDSLRGRGRGEGPSPVKEFALRTGLRVLQPDSLRSTGTQQDFADLAPHVAVIAAYGRLIPPELLAVPPHGFLNIHPSLLPRYRGPSPVVSAILEGLQDTGVSLMLVDESMDGGPVLAQRRAPIRSRETAAALSIRLFRLGGQLLAETLPLWVQGKIAPQTQNHEEATYTRKITKSDGEARWEMTAQELERRFQALTPWPGLYTYWKGHYLKLIAVTAMEQSASALTGLVIPLDREEAKVGVVTGKGVLGLQTLQLSGRRTVRAEDFLLGYRDFVGSRLPN